MSNFFSTSTQSLNDCIVLVPTYNEAENIKELITTIFSLTHEMDIMVIDDNSPDGTAKLVEALKTKFNKESQRLILLKREKKQGLGKAYLSGFAKALDYPQYQYICTMDADFSHNPKDLLKLYQNCKKNKLDLIIGSRYLNGVNVINWPMHRVLISWLASKYVYFITQMPLKDPTSGFKCYSRKSLLTIDLKKIKFIGYAFQIEMKYKIWRKKLKVKEMSIIFTNREKGVSKMDKKIVFEAIWGILLLRFKN